MRRSTSSSWLLKMNLPPDASLKLGRAAQHINDANNAIGDFLARKPFKIVRRFDPTTSNLTLSVKRQEPIPSLISLIVCDAVHNLRATLDLTYFAIIRPLTDRDGNIQFPIYRPDNKKDVPGRRLIKLASKKVGQALEKCQPEPGGAYSIYELDALDVIDKHRLVLLTAYTTDIPANVVNVILPEIWQKLTGEGVIRFTGDGEDIITVPLSSTHPTAKRGAFEDEVKLSTDFGIRFRENGPVQGQVVPTLLDLYRKVEEASSLLWEASLSP